MTSVVCEGARAEPGQKQACTVGAVLLAAGSASRMGHRPKCLLELDGVPLIRRQLMALQGAGVSEVVLVLGHYADRIEPRVQDFSVTIVTNPDPDAGQVSSQRLGLASLGGPWDAVLVALADQPLIQASDIRALIDAYWSGPAEMRVLLPLVDGLPGNPVVFGPDVREAILAGDAQMGCKQWQLAHPAQVRRWPTANRRYRIDLDSPEDVTALAQQTGFQLVWPDDLL